MVEVKNGVYFYFDDKYSDKVAKGFQYCICGIEVVEWRILSQQNCE